MAIQTTLNLLSEQRLGIDDLRRVESAVRNDFDTTVTSIFTNTTQGYVIRGFSIVATGAIGSSANTLQMVVDPGALLHINASAAGTIFQTPSGTPNQILSSASNANVSGSFTANSTNYIGIDYNRFADPTTNVTKYIWNSSAGDSLPTIAPAAQTLTFTIYISNVPWAANVLPIAIVTTDANGNVLTLTDARWNLYSLESGGLTPNPSNVYPWSAGRSRPPVTISSAVSGDPFNGGDKQISCFKDFANAVMTTFLEIKGTPDWFTGSSPSPSPSIASLFQDLGNTIITSSGNIAHGVSPVDNVTLTAAGQVNWNQPINIRVVGSSLNYAIAANSTSTDISLTDDQVAYLSLVREQPISPNLIFTSGSPTVTSVGSVPWTSNLLAGDFIKVAGDDSSGYYQIAPGGIVNAYTVTLTQNVVPADNYTLGIPSQYAFGNYYSSGGPSGRNIVIATRELVPITKNTFWLFARQDNSGSPAVYVRFLGAELDQGESRETDDTSSLQTLIYIGAPTASTTAPNYPSHNFVVNGTSLTTAIGALDSRATTQQTIVNQNQTMRLIDGGTWAFDSGTGVLSWTATAYIAIPSLADTANTISTGSVTIPDGSLAYVVVNRSGAGGIVTPVVVATASFVQADNNVVFARRYGSNIFVGVNDVILGADLSASNITASNSGHTVATGTNVQTQLDELDAAAGNSQLFLGAGFQGFVNPNEFIITATTTTGTPVAGTFYSSITNRASMTDLSQDLKPRMGIVRLTTQQISQVQTESGPNGEPVWSTPNDVFGQIRFVGDWGNKVDINGPHANNTIFDSQYIEVTFYGTGLNFLTIIGSSTYSLKYSVDGGSTTTLNANANQNNVLEDRDYALNQIVPIVSNLTLGTHTVTIKNNSSTDSLDSYGFELLNESSNVTVNSGVGYLAGERTISASQTTFSYSAPVTGTKGGRVLVYQNSDGSIGKSFTATDTLQENLNSATHTNEEIFRQYGFREFGAGRTDDFSGANTAPLAFTLDDGTTGLVLTAGTFEAGVIGQYPESIFIGSSGILSITFVGTGLDLTYWRTQLEVDTYSVTIDGTNVGNLSLGTTLIPAVEKLVSGLPYGTHTVQITRTTNANTPPGFINFIAYQPKTPSLPTSALLLSAYNVFANYDGTTATSGTVAGQGQQPTGALMKTATKEAQFIGTGWTINSVTTGYVANGYNVTTGTQNDAIQLSFFGTGFELVLGGSSGGSTTFTVKVDGTLNSSGVARANGSNSGGGTYTTNTSTTQAAVRIEFTGLTLENHTVLVTRTSTTGANNLNYVATNIITPIYSPNSNVIADLQNSLPIGSQGIQDERALTPVKNPLPATKNWAQAIGVQSSPTTTSTSAVPLTDMSIVLGTNGGALDITFNGTALDNTAGDTVTFYIYVDGQEIISQDFTQSIANYDTGITLVVIVPANSGVHKIDTYWSVSAGSGHMVGTERILIVKER